MKTKSRDESFQRGFSVNSFCKTYGISRSTAYLEMRSGRLKFVRLGKRRHITCDLAEQWQESLPTGK